MNPLTTNHQSLITALLTILLFISPSYASDACEERSLGWHFYCDDEEEEELVEEQSPPPPAPPPESDILEELSAIQEELKRRRARMVLYPTEENVKSYMSYQKEQLDRASHVSDVWRRVVWQTPTLDYTLQRPVNSLGKRAWVDERKTQVKHTVESINERYGVFFVFSSRCKYCHSYSPIIKEFSQTYNIDVVAISQDGGTLPDWPDALQDRGQLKHLGLSEMPVPATFLYDNQDKKLIPVGFGLLAADQLRERIFVMTNVEVGSDY